MDTISLSSAPPTRKWSVDGFARFWANPRNLEIISEVIWPDIKGYWPRCKKPLVGRTAYVKGIADFLAAVPDFRAEVSEYAINGDTTFIRWVATGKPVVGPHTLVGVDRLILRDGFVLENQIHSDHPVFAYLAETETLG